MKTNVYDIADAAKEMGVPRNYLFHWLRDAGYLDQNNTPTLRGTQKNWLIGKPSNEKIQGGHRAGQVYIKPQLTQAGLFQIKNLVTFKGRHKQFASEFNVIAEAAYSAAIASTLTDEDYIGRITAHLGHALTAINKKKKTGHVDKDAANKALAQSIKNIMVLARRHGLNVPNQLLSLSDQINKAS